MEMADHQPRWTLVAAIGTDLPELGRRADGWSPPTCRRVRSAVTSQVARFEDVIGLHGGTRHEVLCDWRKRGVRVGEGGSLAEEVVTRGFEFGISTLEGCGVVNSIGNLKLHCHYVLPSGATPD